MWELGHSLSGLPWWASIPLTSVAVQSLLLPLSVKGRAATTNVVLLNTSIKQVQCNRFLLAL